MQTKALTIVFALSACSGNISGASDDSDGGATGDAVPEAEPSLVLTSPDVGVELVRDNLGGFGALVAVATVEGEVAGPITRIVYYLASELINGAGDAASLGEQRDTSSGQLLSTLEITALGEQTLVAIGYDDDDVERARDSVVVSIAKPIVADCYAWLDLYGLQYERGPNNKGVANPVTVTVPLNGLSHRYISRDNARETFFMDCSLARSLAQAAPMLRRRDVIEVVDYGVYNYRCIGGGTPPDCPRGVSQHAYAKAIDIAGFTTSDGTFYSIKDDWVIDPDGDSTCTAETEPGSDAWLHETICELKGDGVWNIVLTPNYNDSHRDHFHVDLTDGSDFIRFDDSGSVAIPDRMSVDQGPDLH